MKTLGLCLALTFLAIPVMAAIVTENVEYRDGDTVLEGYLAYDDASAETRPGVLVVHAWMGLGEQAKESARRLAELGYVG
ncbi:MAG: dienelactone hydrolase family protein, partial [Candidatus Hydrogenedentes bacterium]|nr:dienelactone hydrolase family protein [Candidatus Hydrogenedentota bacterium]